MAGRAGARAAVVSRLRRVPLFGALGPADLERLAAGATRIRVQAGEHIIREGDPPGGLFILLRGALEVTRLHEGEEVLLARQRPGSFVGEMALLGDAPRNATVRSVGDSEVLRVDAEDFRALLATRPATAVRVLRAVAQRLARTEKALLRREALASLGTLAAGLAHELNNPASAIAASASRLQARIQQLVERSTALGRNASAAAAAERLLHEPPCPADVTDASGRDRLAQWLRSCGVHGSASAAYTLTRCGWTPERLLDRCAGMEPGVRKQLLEWLEARCDAASLAAQLAVSAESISGTVAAVRAHIGAAPEPLVTVDVAATVDHALRMLAPRLREARVTVRAEDGVPAIHGNRAELVQVWTNLLGNALDAGAAKLTIRLLLRRGCVVVQVRDDGRGIPTHAQRRIFDPFFTTREQEGGTGLGLHIVRTVVERHGGHVAVRSRPGNTLFRIRIPAPGASSTRCSNGEAAARIDGSERVHPCSDY
jgi:signal transduction histidine kinase